MNACLSVLQVISLSLGQLEFSERVHVGDRVAIGGLPGDLKGQSDGVRFNYGGDREGPRERAAPPAV